MKLFAMLLSAAGLAAFASLSLAAETPPAVRGIAVEVDPVKASELAEKHGARVFGNQKELAKSLGEGIARQVKGKIDFDKEALVMVTWGTSGPPFGQLRREIKQDKEGVTITFYVLEPDAPVRGQAYQAGCDFFTVHRSARVSFAGAR